jgi:hypothetical protein
MKPKALYHGSGRKIVGSLIPKKAKDLAETKENTLTGIYASDIKNEAIAMGIVSCKGVGHASVGTPRANSKKVIAKIYTGSPKQRYFYLYTLPSKTFEAKPKGSHQWIAFKPVEPNKVERLLVKDYIYLIKKVTKKEKDNFLKKYDKEIK